MIRVNVEVFGDFPAARCVMDLRADVELAEAKERMAMLGDLLEQNFPTRVRAWARWLRIPSARKKRADAPDVVWSADVGVIPDGLTLNEYPPLGHANEVNDKSKSDTPFVQCMYRATLRDTRADVEGLYRLRTGQPVSDVGGAGDRSSIPLEYARRRIGLDSPVKLDMAPAVVKQLNVLRTAYQPTGQMKRAMLAAGRRYKPTFYRLPSAVGTCNCLMCETNRNEQRTLLEDQFNILFPAEWGAHTSFDRAFEGLRYTKPHG